jgi:hypothetical protein
MDIKYGTPRMVRGNTNSSIVRNVAILRERYPRQSMRQDMAIALNVASDVTRLRGHGRPRSG